MTIRRNSSRFTTEGKRFDPEARRWVKATVVDDEGDTAYSSNPTHKNSPETPSPRHGSPPGQLGASQAHGTGSDLPVYGQVSEGSAGKSPIPLGKPERDGAAPAFERGNEAALKHGANSAARIAEMSREFGELLLDVCPWLDRPEYSYALVRYLRAVSVEDTLQKYVDAICRDPAKGPGKVSPKVWEQLTAARRLAARLGTDLGLDPIGFAKLKGLSAGAESAVLTLGELAERGRAIREGRSHRAVLSRVNDGGEQKGDGPSSGAETPFDLIDVEDEGEQP